MIKPLRALIVEDVEDDALLLVRHIERGGYELTYERVDNARSMNAALEQQEWDIVIADYALPGFSGREALKLVKKTGLDIPFIIVSGTIGEEIAVEMMKAGAHDYLMKFSLARLVPAIQRELNEAQIRQERNRYIEALQESERRLSDIISFLPDATLAINKDGQVIAWNKAMEDMTRITADSIMGKGDYEYAIPFYGERRPILVDLAIKSEKDIELRYQYVIKEGSALLAETETIIKGEKHMLWGKAVPLTDKKGNTIGAIESIRDITERKKSEKIQETISKISQSAVASGSMDTFYRDIHTILGELMFVDNFYIALYNPMKNMLHFSFFVDQFDQTPPPRKIEAGLTEYLLNTGNPILLTQSRINELIHQGRIHLFGQKPCSWLGVPLKIEGAIIGVMVAQSYLEDTCFNEGDLRLFELVSNQVAQAIRRKQSEAQIEQQLQKLIALHDIDLVITASPDLRLSLNILVNETVHKLDVDAADILLFDPSLQTLVYKAGFGFHTDALQKMRIQLGEGFAGRAAFERKMIYIPDLSAEHGGDKKSTIYENEKFITYFGVPLIAKGQIKGVLELYHRSLIEPDPAWMSFLESLTSQAAIAIDNATLFDELQRSNIELVKAYDTTLEGWSRALDLRDKETEGHTLRVTEMSIELARILGIKDANLVHIRRGALLHDIGKMGIPDNILFKPGELTEEEWNVMRMHPVYAYNLLSSIEYLRPAIDIPYCHHEKWDGTGYPQGLSKEQIPLSARVFAVVDVWDALTSDRSYRKAWAEHKALEYVQGQAGKHFDPKIVEIFLAERDNILRYFTTEGR